MPEAQSCREERSVLDEVNRGPAKGELKQPRQVPAPEDHGAQEEGHQWMGEPVQRTPERRPTELGRHSPTP